MFSYVNFRFASTFHTCICKWKFKLGFFNIIRHHGHLTKIIYCSPIKTPELMHQQLERSFSSPEVSIPKTIGSGFVLEHFLDFLFSSMCYLLQHWLTWIVSVLISFLLRVSFIGKWNFRVDKSLCEKWISALGDSKAVIADDENDKKNKHSSSRQHGTEGLSLTFSFNFMIS